VFNDRRQQWLGCRCRPSVNTICGRIMIGLSLLSSVIKHNMRSYYDWVFVVVVRQLTQYVVVLWLGCCCCRLSVNTICVHIIIGLLLLSSISKHYVIALWLGCRCRPSVSTIYGRIMIGFIVFVSKHNLWSYCDWVVVVVVHILCLLADDNNDNPIIMQPYIVFTDGRQRQPNHNATTYCVYWQTTTTTTQS
jgi:hypothetical protein